MRSDFAVLMTTKVPLSYENWISVLQWALPVLIVEEVLKAIGRRINANKAKAEPRVAQKAEAML